MKKYIFILLSSLIFNSFADKVIIKIDVANAKDKRILMNNLVVSISDKENQFERTLEKETEANVKFELDDKEYQTDYFDVKPNYMYIIKLPIVSKSKFFVTCEEGSDLSPSKKLCIKTKSIKEAEE